MATNTDHYLTLGVIPEADSVVIKGAYRALASLYHPDRSNDERAGERMAAINEAYEILSDPSKREAYDQQRSTRKQESVFTQAESENPFADNPIEEDWELATRFYANMKNLTKDLEAISWRLAFVFKLAVLEGKRFSEAEPLAQKLKHEYLSQYFGENPKVLKLAERLIKAHEYGAAQYLTDVITVMGSKIDFYLVERDLLKQFEGLATRLQSRNLYQGLFHESTSWRIGSARQLVQLNGGEFRPRIFSEKVDLSLDNEQQTFNSKEQCIDYLVERFKHYA